MSNTKVSLNLGDTQTSVLRAMSNLEWWTLAQLRKRLSFSGSDSSAERLWKRGFIDRREGSGLPFHYEYRLSVAGLEVAIEVGAVK